MSEGVKQKIKFSIIISIVVIAIAIASFMVIKYQVEGEKNLPFNIGKIIVISSAVTTEDDNKVENEENYLWDEKVVQNNDVYIYIDKNNDYKSSNNNDYMEYIKNVRLENIKILEPVKLGKIQIYMPNSLNDGFYKYANDYIVNSTLTYKSAEQSNSKNLEIGAQGGVVCISFANMGLDKYKSNDDTEIVQGAGLLQKMGINNEDLKFKVAFDVVIEANSKTYSTTVILDLPIDELVGNKETFKEYTDFSNLVYKRTK